MSSDLQFIFSLCLDILPMLMHIDKTGIDSVNHFYTENERVIYLPLGYFIVLSDEFYSHVLTCS